MAPSDSGSGAMAGNFVHPANAFYNDVSRTACLVAYSPVEGKDNKTAGGHEETVADHHQGTLRYLAYAARAKALLAIKAKAAGAHLIQVTGGAASGGVRYLAFTSDVGEAVRPVVSRTVVNATYAVAIAYMVGDVAYNGYQASKHGEDVSRAVAHTSAFQLLASLLVPVAVIHTVVHQSSKVAKRSKSPLAKWAPSIAGLVMIPLLPATVDEPIEHGIDYLFDTYWPKTSPPVAAEKPHTD